MNLGWVLHIGVREDSLLAHLETLCLPVGKETALDFRCGVGRLTQALARHFDVVQGVDIAPSMIELANKFNQYGDRCKYHVNANLDLSLFDNETFDFVYTSFVLPHMRPAYSKKYIREFLRVLEPDGVLVFLMTSTKETFLGALYLHVYYPMVRLYTSVHSKIKGPIMERHFIKKCQFLQLLEESGAKAVDITEIIDGRGSYYCRYCVVKT